MVAGERAGSLCAQDFGAVQRVMMLGQDLVVNVVAGVVEAAAAKSTPL